MAGPFARGVAKTVVFAPETIFGEQAPGPGQYLRRVSADMNLQVQQIDSQEILPSQQMRDSRNGPRQVQGSLSGQLSPAAYKLFMEQLLRKTFVAGVVSPSIADSAATINGSTGAFTLSSAASNFLTLGFKKSNNVRLAGLNAGAAVNNAQT